jgi:MICOS complex subunit MIC19
MGSTSSKVQTQEKVFLPKTPTEFSGSIIQKLDSSLESDYTRSQFTDKHIQDRVSSELKQLQGEAADFVNKATEKIAELTDERIGQHDSSSLRQRLEALQHKLDSRPKRGALNEDTLQARDRVVECITKNRERPLNCKKEFSEFQSLVNALV